MSDIEFDFEEMVRLAKYDPDGITRRQKQLIRRVITKFSRSAYLADM